MNNINVSRTNLPHLLSTNCPVLQIKAVKLVEENKLKLEGLRLPRYKHEIHS